MCYIDHQLRRIRAGTCDWVQLQSRAFTVFVNDQLHLVKRRIHDLRLDLSDGVNLIALAEVLSGKKVGPYNRRPVHPYQKLENVEWCLAFLRDEGLRLVNIGSEDIVNHNMKLILGLVWSLIHHYAMNSAASEDRPLLSEDRLKLMLMTFIQAKIPDLNVTNFTTDWKDGSAIGALTNAIAPGLCDNWQSYSTSCHRRQNVANVMEIAETKLGVRQIVRPADVVNRNVSELAMLKYLLQFLEAPARRNSNQRAFQIHARGAISPITMNSRGTSRQLL